MQSFETVIVENHPRLCGDEVLRFRDMVPGQLEIAVGLETVHEPTLAALNKRMTLRDYEKAVRFLCDHEIRVRTFILLRPPLLDEEQGVDWAIRSIQFAFDVGVECCAVIPTRAGNGMLDQLAAKGLFESPTMQSMERVLDSGFADGTRPGPDGLVGLRAILSLPAMRTATPGSHPPDEPDTARAAASGVRLWSWPSMTNDG